MSAVAIPEVGPLKRVPLPTTVDRTLANGLQVVAARRAGIPRLEARLHIPLSRGGTPVPPAPRRLLTAALLSGTGERSAVQIAEDLQSMGASLDVTADADDMIVFGSTLSNHAERFLDLLAEIVLDAAFPDDEVELQRERAVQELRVAHTQPDVIARQAFIRRLYGRHPYGAPLPKPEAVGRVSAAAARELKRTRLLPKGAVLVLVGDLRPERVLEGVAARFAPWKARGAAPGLPAPDKPRRGPIMLVDRPGSVQTNIRMGRPAARRTDPTYPRQVLANLVFGGYFAARLSNNIREDKGYTYGAYSLIETSRSAAHMMITTNVATEVTVPALVEIRYELGRMVAEPPPEQEVTAAKRYLAGTMAMGVATQPGLASMLAMLAMNGLPISYLRDFPAAVEALTPDDVYETACGLFDARQWVTVLVGEAGSLQPRLAPLDDVAAG